MRATEVILKSNGVLQKGCWHSVFSCGGASLATGGCSLLRFWMVISPSPDVWGRVKGRSVLQGENGRFKRFLFKKSAFLVLETLDGVSEWKIKKIKGRCFGTNLRTTERGLILQSCTAVGEVRKTRHRISWCKLRCIYIFTLLLLEVSVDLWLHCTGHK